MSDENKVRLAHDVLDGLSAGRILSRENEQLLRSFLPELPKQKTLEEIHKYVDDAWLEADDPELKEWLHELHFQLKGLEVTATIAPGLPAGMRIAEHEAYGLCVVSPVTDGDNERRIFYLDPGIEGGADSRWVPFDSLTFIDAAPAAPAHPEFLEIEADYRNAPFGTIVVGKNYYPWTKTQSSWLAYGAQSRNDFEMRACRRHVLRWGDK